MVCSITTSSFLIKFLSLLISYYIKRHIFSVQKTKLLVAFCVHPSLYLFSFFISIPPAQTFFYSPKGIFFIENKPSESIEARCVLFHRGWILSRFVYKRSYIWLVDVFDYIHYVGLAKCVGRNALRMTDSHFSAS